MAPPVDRFNFGGSLDCCIKREPVSDRDAANAKRPRAFMSTGPSSQLVLSGCHGPTLFDLAEEPLDHSTWPKPTTAQPNHFRNRLLYSFTATIPSISTEIWLGSATFPTAERA